MDLFPVKAQFLSGEEVILRLETGGDFPCAAQVTVSCLNKIILQKTVQVISENGSISLGRFDTDFGGYGVDAVISTSTDRTILRTAFDVAERERQQGKHDNLLHHTCGGCRNCRILHLELCPQECETPPEPRPQSQVIRPRTI